jgi:glycosyltransferase involved in cell wall biosynthesis
MGIAMHCSASAVVGIPTRAERGSPRADGVVLAHDYATQRGGAERVALKIAEAFPGAPMFTTLYEPDDTFSEFRDVDMRPGRLNRYSLLRQHHRLALPMLAPAVDAQRLSAELLIASSTGWAHGYQGADHTIVYCHAPARWLYQTDRYLGSHRNPGMRGLVRQTAARTALNGLMSPLREWDRRSARRADLYLANSTVTQRAIAEVYGIEAEVLSPPPALTPSGPEREVDGVQPGYLLCVARLLPYKNVDVIIEAVNSVADARLVVVGSGPDRERLLRLAGPRVQLLGSVEDDQLRWLYRNAEALVAASFEDYGLSPLEAGGFGRPSIVLRAGGFLDTVAEGRTGIFFDEPTPAAMVSGIREARQCSWEEQVITDHVDQFSSRRFVSRLQDIADRVRGIPVSVPAQREARKLVRTDMLVA